MRRTPILIGTAVVAGVIAVTVAAKVEAAPTAGTLQLKATVAANWNLVGCPAGTDPSLGCYAIAGGGVVPGLGKATESYVETQDVSSSCPHTTFTPVVITVTGKGEIDATVSDGYSCDPPAGDNATFAFTITGGSGAYAGATGSGSLTNSNINDTILGKAGVLIDTWTGSLAVAGATFDTTPPSIAGAKNVVVTTKSRAGARVRYALTATDAVDGAVQLACKPESGVVFHIGRTNVTCTATDSSGNTATTRFTVTVKRTHHR